MLPAHPESIRDGVLSVHTDTGGLFKILAPFSFFCVTTPHQQAALLRRDCRYGARK